MTRFHRSIVQTDRDGWNVWIVFDPLEWLLGVSGDNDGWLWVHLPMMSLAIFKEHDGKDVREQGWCHRCKSERDDIGRLTARCEPCDREVVSLFRHKSDEADITPEVSGEA